eukprot:7014873-Heterocapsa_arctica.AAC.1
MCCGATGPLSPRPGTSRWCRCATEALGLRSVVRTAPTAWWASWADALPMMNSRQPGFIAAV